MTTLAAATEVIMPTKSKYHCYMLSWVSHRLSMHASFASTIMPYHFNFTLIATTDVITIPIKIMTTTTIITIVIMQLVVNYVSWLTVFMTLQLPTTFYLTLPNEQLMTHAMG